MVSKSAYILLFKTLPNEMPKLFCNYMAVMPCDSTDSGDPNCLPTKNSKLSEDKPDVSLGSNVVSCALLHFSSSCYLALPSLIIGLGKGMRSAFPLLLRPLFMAPPDKRKATEVHCIACHYVHGSLHLGTAVIPLTDCRF